MKNKIYFDNLDGWRTVSFLMVFFYHSFYTENQLIIDSPIYQFITKKLFINGNIGVNFFFVLSGFLISYFIILEKKSSNKINLPKFWARRVLRIWPLYFFCVLFGFLLFPLFKSMLGQTSMETANIIYYLTFTSNFDLINNGLPDASILGVLWSVSIEEQFYMIWPILLLVVPFKRYNYLFIILILISLWFRSKNPAPISLEVHSFSCMVDLVVGGFSAWLIIQYPVFLERIRKTKKPLIGLVYLIFLLFIFYRGYIVGSGFVMMILERMFLASVIAFIILEQNFSENSFFKMKNNKVLTRLGKYTYGLYCLHFIGILIAIQSTKLLGLNNQLWQVIFLETAIALITTLIFAFFSYRYLEQPFLKLKEKFI